MHDQSLQKLRMDAGNMQSDRAAYSGVARFGQNDRRTKQGTKPPSTRRHDSSRSTRRGSRDRGIRILWRRSLLFEARE